MTVDSTAPSRLKSLVERIERLNEDLAAIKSDVKEVFAEAGGDGFNPKIIRMVIKIRATDRAKRQEEAALIDLYMSALEGGGWDEPSAPGPTEPRAGDPSTSDAPDGDAEPKTQDTPAEAAAAGRLAAQDGVAVTANPYPAGSQQRVAWDMAWCAQTGTDGMDIPDHLKPGAKRS